MTVLKPSVRCTNCIKHLNLDTLSMGMSSDFISAIENGSNMLRIGQEIFGKKIMKNHISIIGAGNLTNSILEGIKKSNKDFKIQVIDINKKKRNISKKYNVIFKSSYTEDISNSEIIMISSKPKDYHKGYSFYKPIH